MRYAACQTVIFHVTLLQYHVLDPTISPLVDIVAVATILCYQCKA